MKLLNDGILHINPASMVMGHIPTATKRMLVSRWNNVVIHAIMG